MKKVRLVIGDKNYSSWSLVPWLMLKMYDVDFDEICIKANQTCGESLRDQAVSGTPRLAIRLNDQQPVRSSKLNSPFASFEGHGLPAAKGERLPTGEVDDSRDLSEQSSCLQKVRSCL